MTHFPEGPSVTINFMVNEQGIEGSQLLPGKAQKGLSLNILGVNRSKKLENQIESWLAAYVSRLPASFHLPLLFPSTPPFTLAVLKHLITIPFASTASYGEIAAIVRSASACRAVGNACNRNPFPLVVPCHRVTAAKGKIGGFAMELSIKKELLSFENP
jgi:methylated-DNA-[protein]-cysteine S-methyltransferase